MQVMPKREKFRKNLGLFIGTLSQFFFLIPELNGFQDPNASFCDLSNVGFVVGPFMFIVNKKAETP